MRRNGAVSLTVADNGTWEPGDEGTGLSIVRALVRDELNGELSLSGEAGLTPGRASVTGRVSLPAAVQLERVREARESLPPWAGS